MASPLVLGRTDAGQRAVTDAGSIPWYLWSSRSPSLPPSSARTGTFPGTAPSAAIRFGRPPHMAIYLCGILAGLFPCGYAILRSPSATRLGQMPGSRLGVSRSARRVYRLLGRHRHADLGAFR